MKIALYTSTKDSKLHRLTDLFGELGLAYENNPVSTSGFDIAISYGGDGTFLNGVRQMGHNPIPIMGINSGRLGFLSTVAKADARKALEQIVRGDYQVECRSMLQVVADNIPHDIMSMALNEFSIQKSTTTMIYINIEIDGHSAGEYWSDGVILSTPTGSTAYSMSVGGAIVSPNCKVFILSPIAPHNLNVRPLVISDTSTITIVAKSRDGGPAIATVDNQEYQIESKTRFTLHRAEQEIGIIKLPKSNFYHTIREKLLWGVDPRN